MKENSPRPATLASELRISDVGGQMQYRKDDFQRDTQVSQIYRFNHRVVT